MKSTYQLNNDIFMDIERSQFLTFTMSSYQNMINLIKFQNTRHQMYRDLISKRFSNFHLEIWPQKKQKKKSMALVNKFLNSLD